MSDQSSESRIVDISGWIERAKRDPLTYVERQATEIVLSAIGSLPGFRGHFFLKGGILMAVVYNSPRNTGDLDFTTNLPPAPTFGDELKAALNRIFPSIAARLGYPDLLLRVQSVREMPRSFAGPTLVSFPALKVGIAYARRGQPEARFLETGAAPTAITVEISFNEPVHAVELIQLSVDGPTVNAYSITELIAEKLRALLQQVPRNRYRRQDVYDIAHLIDRFSLDADEYAAILETFRSKCQARGMTPTTDALDNPELIRRAGAEWETLKQEVGDLPDFNACMHKVQRLYRNLPW